MLFTRKTLSGRAFQRPRQLVRNESSQNGSLPLRAWDQTTQRDEPGFHSDRATRFERNWRKLKSGLANEKRAPPATSLTS